VRLDSARTLYDSPRLRLDEECFTTPVGPVMRAVVHHPGAVAIIAQPAPGLLLLVRQYRYPVRRWTLEIPAGTRVPGEELLATAQRELGEEAGFAATRWTRLGAFIPSIGICDEELVVFRAEDLRPVPMQPDHGELVSPAVVRLAECPGLVADGSICDAKTLIALAVLGVTPFAAAPAGSTRGDVDAPSRSVVEAPPAREARR